MKWNELRRIAEAKGWYLWRNGGNHDVYRHPDSEDFLYIERRESQEIRHGLYCKLRKTIGF
ncbi:MAG: type II toxin-antitoxin system HicA family toxin [Bacteroidales bacterium]|nr:type II toxin-antitoxin system HicA family toxin [Bacteroidales bacterium]